MNDHIEVERDEKGRIIGIHISSGFWWLMFWLMLFGFGYCYR
jgi:hypothetical protein